MQVEYDDDEGKYVKMNELLNKLATEKEINSQQIEVKSVRRKETGKKPKSKLNSVRVCVLLIKSNLYNISSI